MYNFEVLPVSNEVKYEKRSAAKGIHVLGGEEYMVSSKGWEAKVLTSGNLGENMDFVSDGDLLVMIDLTDSNYTDIADVNAQLVLVTDVNNEFSNQGIYNNMGIEYMTIDGETHIATYAQLLTKDNSRGTITTAVAGYLNINLEGAESKGYLYITDVNYEDEDGIAYTVVLDDATEPTQVYLSSASKKAIKDGDLKIAEQILYKYTYNKINDDYTLTQVEFGQASFECEIFDLDGVELYAGRDADHPTVSKLDKETIAIVDVTVELEVGNEDAHDPLAFKYGDVAAKFVDLEDLEASMIVNGEYEGQGVYRFSDYCYTANDILYVIVYHVENYANGGAEITGATLYNGLMNAVDAKPYVGQ